MMGVAIYCPACLTPLSGIRHADVSHFRKHVREGALIERDEGGRKQFTFSRGGFRWFGDGFRVDTFDTVNSAHLRWRLSMNHGGATWQFDHPRDTEIGYAAAFYAKAKGEY